MNQKRDKYLSFALLGYIIFMVFYLPTTSPAREDLRKIHTPDINKFDTMVMKTKSAPKAKLDNKGRVVLDETNYVTVLATKYNAVASQCDADPLITADNSKINLKKLNSYKLKWIAVSRDMLKVFNLDMGDKVIIECDNPNLCGVWEIHDKMNKRFSRRIDLLVPLNDKYEFNKPMKVKLRKVVEEVN